MNMIEEFKALVDEFAAKADRVIERAKQTQAAQEQPPVTGRPFTKEKPPKRNGMVYSRDDMAESGCYVFSYCPDDPDHTGALKHGELYPTEADCLYGEKKREIEARYRGMGEPFSWGDNNWYAHWNHVSNKISLMCITDSQHYDVYFYTRGDCQAAIDTINREYGKGAFEEFVLGVIK